MRAWGWRIPFAIGATLAIIAVMMRSSLHETEAFIEARTPQRGDSSIRALFRYPREVLIWRLPAGSASA
jgi:MHS family alpha-ketoglutarate permease-like MFS transporter